MKKMFFGLYGRFILYAVAIGSVQTVVQIFLRYLMQRLFGEIHPLLLDVCNILVILLMLLVIVWHYNRYLERIGGGINALARGESVRLSEEGAAKELAMSINRTSEILEEQRETIERRDTARMEWIRGISHDVRTPLSMVMGYSEILEEEPLSREQLHCVMIIKEQSIKMKALIEDLNLTSKLEYDRHPLRLASVRLAELLRNAAAGAMNADVSAADKEDAAYETADSCTEDEIRETHSIELLILPEFEGLEIQADRSLMERVFDNLIGNAIRHNPRGCSIMILAYRTGTRAIVEIKDDGKGIPDEVARIINAVGSEFSAVEEDESLPEAETKAEEADSADHLTGLRTRPHILGMRIAKQIILAHGGNLFIKPDRHTVEIVLDLEPETAENKMIPEER